MFSLATVEVGTRLEWNLAGLAVHGQVLIVTWLVIAIIGIAIVGTLNLPTSSKGLQNFVEAVFEYVSVFLNQLGEYSTVRGFLTSVHCFCLSLLQTG